MSFTAEGRITGSRERNDLGIDQRIRHRVRERELSWGVWEGGGAKDGEGK